MKLDPLLDVGRIEATLHDCTVCKGDKEVCQRCQLLAVVLNGWQTVEVEDDLLTKDTKGKDQRKQ
jgi:hypothetical protein